LVVRHWELWCFVTLCTAAIGYVFLLCLSGRLLTIFYTDVGEFLGAVGSASWTK